jgi:hypothetical protein
VGLRNQLRRLERTLRGQRASFELQDGSTYWCDEGEAWQTIFTHGSDCLRADYQVRDRPEPSDVLRAISKARDRRAAVGNLYSQGSFSLMAYDADALVERGEFVPRSFLAGVEYGPEYFRQLSVISER